MLLGSLMVALNRLVHTSVLLAGLTNRLGVSRHVQKGWQHKILHDLGPLLLGTDVDAILLLQPPCPAELHAKPRARAPHPPVLLEEDKLDVAWTVHAGKEVLPLLGIKAPVAKAPGQKISPHISRNHGLGSCAVPSRLRRLIYAPSMACKESPPIPFLSFSLGMLDILEDKLLDIAMGGNVQASVKSFVSSV